MYHARGLVMASDQLAGAYDAELASKQSGVQPQWYEEWYDGLGYCEHDPNPFALKIYC